MGTKGLQTQLQSSCSPHGGSRVLKPPLVTAVYANQWEAFASKPLLPGVPSEEILYTFDAFFYFLRKAKGCALTKRLENEQNIRTRKAESASSESVGLYRECEYCQAGLFVLLMCIILPNGVVTKLACSQKWQSSQQNRAS